MKLLPLGTVLEVKTRKVSVIGFGSVDKESGSTAGYFVVPYPLGFVSAEKVFFIPHDEAFKVLSEGYKTDVSEQVLDLLARSFEAAEALSPEAIDHIQKAVKRAAAKAKEGQA